jgi:hypothetical protein
MRDVVTVLHVDHDIPGGDSNVHAACDPRQHMAPNVEGSFDYGVAETVCGVLRANKSP